MEKNEQIEEEVFSHKVHDESTVPYWKAVKAGQKKNLKKEEEQLEHMKETRLLMDKKRARDEEQMELNLQESKLIRNLYGEHGEDFIKTQSWKTFADTKFAFDIKIKTEDKKNYQHHFVLQLKKFQQAKSECESLIVQYKTFIKEAIAKVKEIEKKKAVTPDYVG